MFQSHSRKQLGVVQYVGDIMIICCNYPKMLARIPVRNTKADFLFFLFSCLLFSYFLLKFFVGKKTQGADRPPSTAPMDLLFLLGSERHGNILLEIQLDIHLSHTRHRQHAFPELMLPSYTVEVVAARLQFCFRLSQLRPAYIGSIVCLVFGRCLPWHI